MRSREAVPQPNSGYGPVGADPFSLVARFRATTTAFPAAAVSAGALAASAKVQAKELMMGSLRLFLSLLTAVGIAGAPGELDSTELKAITDANRRDHFGERLGHFYAMHLYLDYQDGAWPEMRDLADARRCRYEKDTKRTKP